MIWSKEWPEAERFEPLSTRSRTILGQENNWITAGPFQKVDTVIIHCRYLQSFGGFTNGRCFL